jgi:hypothetical protein
LRHLNQRFVRFVEKGKELVEFLVQNRIVLVRMALSATDGQAQPHGAGSADTIDICVKAKLLRIDAPFFVDHRIAMKAGRDDVVDGAVRQHVTGNLFD